MTLNQHARDTDIQYLPDGLAPGFQVLGQVLGSPR